MGEKWPRNFAESDDFHVTFGMLKNVIQPKFTDFQVLRVNRVTKCKFNIFPALNYARSIKCT
jgi:hypothetical protein